MSETEKIFETGILREEGYLYFLKGNPMCVFKVKANRKGRIKKKSEE